jgi:membrane associated rhomboid family serine protease
MFKSLTPATRAILVANLIVYLVYVVCVVFELFGGLRFMIRLALFPPQSHWFEPWQVITYAFRHNGVLHLLFNMLGLVMFGRVLEAEWGTRNFLIYFFASVLAAAGTQLLWTSITGVVEPTIGASGGVFGLLLGFAALFPRRQLMVLPLPIPIRAWILVTLYGIVELVMGVTNTQAGVAHFAHLGGMVGGGIVMAFWRGPKPARRR